MRKLLFPTALCLLSCIAALAQAQTQQPAMSVATGDSFPTIIVTNPKNTDSMTACLVTIDLTASHRRLTRLYFDVYGNDYGRGKSIPSGASLRMPLPHWANGPLPVPTLRAAIFEDGATWGEEPWVNELLEMRKILWQRAGEASAVLRSIQRFSGSKAASVLRWERQFRKDAAADAPAEKQLAHDRLFAMMEKNLDQNSRAFGKPKETLFVIRHLAGFFDDWRASLEGAKPSLVGWSPTTPSAVDIESRLAQVPVSRDKAKLLLASFHPLPRTPPPLPTCTTATESNEAATVIAVVGICGNQTWELKATFSGQLFDKGPQEAFGACTGGFADCQGNQVPQGKEVAMVQIFNATAPPHSIGFGWNVDDWIVPTPQGCSSCDPNPGGEQVPTPANHQFPTPAFFVDCQ
jgi:hypothetical protein